jgi:hypothetical protein
MKGEDQMGRNKKGQDCYPALKTGSSKELPSDSACLNVALKDRNVNDRMVDVAEIRSATLRSRPYFLKTPLAGLKPASPTESEWSSIHLSYRGALSNKSTKLTYNQSLYDGRAFVKTAGRFGQ